MKNNLMAMMLLWICCNFLLPSSSSLACSVLIDPGHGGEENGALYINKNGIVPEKALSLIFANKIKNEIEKKCSVYLTRSMDKTLELAKRAALAELVKADIFISVHLNSGPKGVRGFETYYLDNHKNSAIKKIEDVENIVIGADNSEVQKILIDLAIEQTVVSSKELARNVHGEIGKIIIPKHGVPSRGVRPGLFYVLALAMRPSILLEVGYPTNPKEFALLTTDDFQNEYAKGVSMGIFKYLRSKGLLQDQ